MSYAYGELENKLIDLFLSEMPDFNAARDLIKQGADVNAVGKDDTQNILSEILSSYYWLYSDDIPGDDGDSNAARGSMMCAVIRFFLNRALMSINAMGVLEHSACGN